MKGLFGKKAATESKPKRFKVFGVPLEEVCERENLPIPSVAEETIEYLEQNGTKIEGLFRICGNAASQDLLKAYYNGESNEMPLEKCDDIHAVAGILKLYLRELPDPLLTHQFYGTFIAVQKNQDPSYRMTNIRKLVNALPPCNKVFLTRLCAFLSEVAKDSAVNKMTEHNLAIVFGPNLLRPKDGSMQKLIQNALYVNGVMQSLIEEFDFLVTCTAMQPKKAENQTAVSPRLELAFSISPRGEYNSANGGSSSSSSAAAKRRAFKFSVVSEEGSPPDREASGSEGMPLAEQEQDETDTSDSHTESPTAAAAITTTTTTTTTTTSSSRAALLLSVDKDQYSDSHTPPGQSSMVEFDLDQPLEYAIKKIQEFASEANRPLEIDQMTSEQLVEEKVCVKRQLRHFDTAFKAKYGFEPAKRDKEVLRALYQRYRDLSRLIELSQSKSNIPEMNAPGSLEENFEYQALKKEKRQLQCYLHQYQADFIKKNGRRVQYFQDRAPVQTEYDRYRALKVQLQALEMAFKKSSASVEK